VTGTFRGQGRLGRWMRVSVKRICMAGRFVIGQFGRVTFCDLDLFVAWTFYGPVCYRWKVLEVGGMTLCFLHQVS
jgi:hypothetical protein